MSEEIKGSRGLHSFIIQVAVLLHRFGTPSHRFERVMNFLTTSLGLEGVFLYTPTAIVLSLVDGDGEHTYVRRVETGSVDVDKLIRFDQTLDQLVLGTISIEEARTELDAIAQAPPPFPHVVTILAYASACSILAVLFRGTVSEIMTAWILGLVVGLIDLFLLRHNLEERGLLQPCAGFVSAMGSLALARFVLPIDDRLVTLAALIIMIPGLSITVSLTELAVGHLSAGVSRLAGALTHLLTMVVGVAVAWHLAGAWRNIPDISRGTNPVWWRWAAAFVAPICFAIIFRARPRQWPIIICISFCGFVVSYFSKLHWGPEAGAFLGALLVSMSSNGVARILKRPAMVYLTSGILLLVPGSLGYQSLAAFLDQETTQGIVYAFNMLSVVTSLVGGILTGNILLPPRRLL